MPEQKPKDRVKNFMEVPYGYDEVTAINEAKRCLQCKNKPCMEGCPVEIDIPGFIKCIAEGDFDKAIEVIKSKNSLPAVSGRVCPYEEQCEGLCTLKKIGEPVGIGRLERFLADYERKKGVKNPPKIKQTGKKAAIIGAGPAGLIGHGATGHVRLRLPRGRPGVCPCPGVVPPSGRSAADDAGATGPGRVLSDAW